MVKVYCCEGEEGTIWDVTCIFWIEGFEDIREIGFLDVDTERTKPVDQLFSSFLVSILIPLRIDHRVSRGADIHQTSPNIFRLDHTLFVFGIAFDAFFSKECESLFYLRFLVIAYVILFCELRQSRFWSSWRSDSASLGRL